ncbi:hypothetical protein FQR65_LT10207 [Abscondita terminalis]|nr:hypothetical protein FQR65_LT10207 [Abscondita terminalis]
MSLKLMSAIIPITPTLPKNEDANKVLTQLLENVQSCQKRFGGKTELATEFDNCVAALCLSLESVFCHGIRSKPQEVQPTNAFKQVSDIVTSSLSISGDNNSFWPFIKKHLTKHEKERYEVLKHIWTDVGRGRAWIRSSLNERSLERNFHAVLSNLELLRTYYEDWALLCDEEKNSMLPNMAAGLGSILFAVSIDKPELNSQSISQKSERLRVQAEPIIEAPIRDSNKDYLKERRKRKVAKQIISFDEDDSVLSSSIPSSSSSITSDNTVDLPRDLLKDSPTFNSGEETSNMGNSELQKSDKRKLSLETSGTHNKFSFEIDGTLTPVEQSNVGELTPVSTVKNEGSDSPDTSDDIIEVPTDISSLLVALENKSKDEILKLREIIKGMTSENDSLKEQLKKYVSAVQMLRRDDVSLHKALEGLQLDGTQIPDYKSEAKVFEEKLVQVAEMHAELMDFNVHLQTSLRKKDAALERLHKELEELRGPMEVLDEDVHCSVSVWVPSAFLTGTGSDVHHVYQIFLRAGSDEWNIYRRYAQFYALHTDLKKLDPAVTAFDFPPKKSIGKKDSTLVENRRKRLQAYLRRILSHWPELAHCNSRFLLEQHLAFFKDLKVNDDRSARSRRNIPGTTIPHYTGL